MELIISLLVAFTLGAFILSKLGIEDVKKEPKSKAHGFMWIIIIFVVGFVALSIIYSIVK